MPAARKIIKQHTRPRVQLTGGDGNAFYVLGLCRRAALAAGWSIEQWQRVRDEMTAGDYDHLLAMAQTYFDVE